MSAVAGRKLTSKVIIDLIHFNGYSGCKIRHIRSVCPHETPMFQDHCFGSNKRFTVLTALKWPLQLLHQKIFPCTKFLISKAGEMPNFTAFAADIRAVSVGHELAKEL